MAQKSKKRAKPAAKKRSPRSKSAKRRAAPRAKAKPAAKRKSAAKPKRVAKVAKRTKAAKKKSGAAKARAKSKPPAKRAAAHAKPAAARSARTGAIATAKSVPGGGKAIAKTALPQRPSAPVRPASPAKPKAPPISIPTVSPSPSAKPAAHKPTTRLHRVAARPEPPPAPPAPPPVPLDLAVLRARLETKKQEIMAMYLKDLRSGQESNDSPTEDIVDRANNAYSRELNFSISDTERSLLLQVDEAIARIDNGRFGRCSHCGQPIARPRLEAIPWARLCINCQELLEQGLLPEG